MQIAVKAIGRFGAEVSLDASDSEIHLGEAPGGRVALLAEDADVADTTAVHLDEFLALDEHASRAAAGVEDAAFVGREHFD